MTEVLLAAAQDRWRYTIWGMQVSDAHDRPTTAGNSVSELLETIQRLGFPHQDRMLRLVLLLTKAPSTVDRVVQQMLRRLLTSPPKSSAECIAEVDAIIELLEEGCDNSDWDAHFVSATSRVASSTPRLN